MKILIWILRVVPAALFLMTLFFKFSGAEESVKLFADLSMEAFGTAEYESMFRIGTGVVELIAALLLLNPKSTVWGALMGAGTMSGAVLSHLLFIGIDRNDGGQLFGMGVVALICCVILLWILRGKLPVIGVKMA